MLNKIRKRITAFVTNNKEYPIITVFIASLYPLLYYYYKNYALTNSWSQFIFLSLLYFILPITFYFVAKYFVQKVFPKGEFLKYLLPVFNWVYFLGFIVISVFGFQKKKLVLAVLLGLVLGILLYKHIKKVIVLQFLLVFLVIPKLIPDIYRELVYTTEWMEQPDDIEQVIFKNKPNVYLIQPDGYANFSSFKNALHNYDNSKFEFFLKNKGFTSYPNYRSNYFSTLSSNSSLLSMKHHYYGNADLGINPSFNLRNVIVESNPVIKAFKNNNYKTFLMLQVPYLLSNRPEIGFDCCNFSLDEVPYMSRGFSKKKDLLLDTKTAILNNKSTNNFFFIESMKPSHIVTVPNSNINADMERLEYLERIEDANQWLIQLVNFITTEDPNGLIIIASDHGGYVGLNSTYESKTKVGDPLIIDSFFSSILAIKWPDNEIPEYDINIETSVNLFRVLFSYLSEDETYLNHLQDDKSYIVIENGAPFGVYEYINENSEVTFKKYKE